MTSEDHGGQRAKGSGDPESSWALPHHSEPLGPSHRPGDPESTELWLAWEPQLGDAAPVPSSSRVISELHMVNVPGISPGHVPRVTPYRGAQGTAGEPGSQNKGE